MFLINKLVLSLFFLYPSP